MLKGFVTVGAWTLASRMLGFVRDMMTAFILGTGPVADAYFVALRLPNLFRNLFGEGAFNAAFVPGFTKRLTVEGEDSARRFAEEAFSVMATWLLILTLLGEIFMPAMMRLLAPGFAQDGERLALAVTFGRVTFPYLLMICLAALIAGVLNGLHRFAQAAAGYIYFNIVQIAALLFAVPFVPTAGHALSYGVAISGVLQLGALWRSAARAGMRLTLRAPRLTPGVRQLLARMAPGLIGAGVSQLNIAVDSIIASLLPAGTVSVLNYADRVNQLPLGVLGSAVGMALLPTLTRDVQSGAAVATLNRAIAYSLSLAVPASVGLAILAQPIMGVLFAHGAFSEADGVRSGECLSAFAIGLPFFVLVKVLAPGFFARGDTRTPLKVAMGTVALNLAFNLAFMHPLAHRGPPLASSLAAVGNAACLGLLLARQGAFAPDRALLGLLPRIFVAAALMGAALLIAAGPVMLAAGSGHAARVAGLGVIVAIGLGVYAVAGAALGVVDMRAMIGRVRRKLAPR